MSEVSTRGEAKGISSVARGLALGGGAAATLAIALLLTGSIDGPSRWPVVVLVEGAVVVAAISVWRSLSATRPSAPPNRLMRSAIDDPLVNATLGTGSFNRNSAPPEPSPAPTNRPQDASAPARAPAAVDIPAHLLRLRFDQRLEAALDAARNEEEVLGVVTRAAESISPIAPTELLLAGARGTTIRQAAEAGPDGEGPGCPVPHPGECEAMRLGTTRRYPSSSGFDACPHLRGRIGRPCSATCVPVRVLGRSIGVLHRIDPMHEPAEEAVVATLESLASKSGTRLSIVRAATNTVPAAFDPSTGLLDRASTERHVVDLGRDLTPFSLAQGDIDHFQEYLRINGRDAANRAIRLVARVMQEILRPTDVIGRFGEDEFLVILPHASDGQAQRALERVREHLALTLATSSIPWFTVSFGVVEASFAQTLDDLLVAADVAVSMAKDLGRNRVVVADEELIDPRVEDEL